MQGLKFEKQSSNLHSTLNVLGIAYKPDGTVGARFTDVVEFDFGDEEQIDQFKQHALKRGVQFNDNDFTDNRDFIKRSIKYEIFYNKFGVSDAARVLLEDDPQVLKAVDLIPEAKELASKARRQVAEKR